MSEGLSPEKIVGILNRYLGMVTEAIFKNDGTLDKFIGDAVMAVYNAPLDVEDYACKAVPANTALYRFFTRSYRSLLISTWPPFAMLSSHSGVGGQDKY